MKFCKAIFPSLGNVFAKFQTYSPETWHFKVKKKPKFVFLSLFQDFFCKKTHLAVGQKVEILRGYSFITWECVCKISDLQSKDLALNCPKRPKIGIFEPFYGFFFAKKSHLAQRQKVEILHGYSFIAWDCVCEISNIQSRDLAFCSQKKA